MPWYTVPLVVIPICIAIHFYFETKLRKAREEAKEQSIEILDSLKKQVVEEIQPKITEEEEVTKVKETLEIIDKLYERVNDTFKGREFNEEVLTSLGLAIQKTGILVHLWTLAIKEKEACAAEEEE